MDKKPVQLLLDFNSPDHLRRWMKSSGYSPTEIASVMVSLADWDKRPEPTEFALRLWARSRGADTVKEIISTIEKFLHKDIGYKDLKQVLDKYK